MRIVLLAASAGLAAAGVANATVYTQDHNLADFETGVYGTFSNYSGGGLGKPFAPYTPTNADLANTVRVYGGKKPVPGLSTSNDWILVTFDTAASSIRVIPEIDQNGSPTDGYQYAIEGSNDGQTWTALYDTTSVSGSGSQYTIGSFTGTAPTSVNNVLAPNKRNNAAGYIADFTFGAAYKYFALGASTQAFLYGDGAEPADRSLKPEFMAVAALSSGAPAGATPVPEPASWAMMLIGLGTAGGLARRRRRGLAAA